MNGEQLGFSVDYLPIDPNKYLEVEIGRARKGLRDALAEEVSVTSTTGRALERVNLSLEKASTITGRLRPTCVNGISNVDSSCEIHRNTPRAPSVSQLEFDLEPIQIIGAVVTVESFPIYSSPDEQKPPELVRKPIVTVELKDTACPAPMQADYDKVKFGFDENNV